MTLRGTREGGNGGTRSLEKREGGLEGRNRSRKGHAGRHVRVPVIDFACHEHRADSADSTKGWEIKSFFDPYQISISPACLYQIP